MAFQRQQVWTGMLKVGGAGGSRRLLFVYMFSVLRPLIQLEAGLYSFASLILLRVRIFPSLFMIPR